MGSFHLYLANEGRNSFREPLDRFPPFFHLCPSTLLAPELFLNFSRSRIKGREGVELLKLYKQKQIIMSLEIVLLLRGS